MSVEVVTQVKEELLAKGENLDGPCGAAKITHTVAWRLRHDGWGVVASGGNGCDQTPHGNLRADSVMRRSGATKDVLTMSENNEGKVFPEVPHESYNIPAWNDTGPQAPENWREPYNPGFLEDVDGGTDPGTEEPGGGAADTEMILASIVESEERVNTHTTYEAERVLEKMDDLRQEVIKFAEQAEEFLKKLAVFRREGRPGEPPEES